MTIQMNELAQGQRGTVLHIGAEDEKRARLLDLGLVPGTGIERIFDSPAGDPVCYNVRGAMIALRTADANQIAVEIGEEEAA